jgi:hypothetical protein
LHISIRLKRRVSEDQKESCSFEPYRRCAAVRVGQTRSISAIHLVTCAGRVGYSLKTKSQQRTHKEAFR